MKPEVLEKLREARDFHALTKAVLGLCEPFGPVHSFRLIHNRGAHRVACFIELESPRLQPALARALGTGAASGMVSMDIPVRPDFGDGAKVVALAPSAMAAGATPPAAQARAGR
ncbi:MAG TPA: hypothetical protein VK043_16240 [Burkholderiales bacterium]|nr:hypothetical protein [Burkholderiales bacterium]